MTSSEEPLTTRQQQAQIRREQIIETALRLFAHQGYDGTSTRQIARETGITEGLIFHYFPSKADLLAAVLETRHSFAGELRTFLTAAEAEPVGEVLPQVATGWLSTLRREEAITLVLLSVAQTDPKVGEAFQAMIREGAGWLATYLAARVEAGELRVDLPLESSALMFFASLIVFFISRRGLAETEWEKQTQIFTTEMISVWLNGAAA